MKQFILAIFFFAVSGSGNSQLLLSEDFTSPFFPNANWILINNSQSPGSNWFNGNGSGVFPAFNGGPSDYIAVNYASTTNTSSPQTLSNWLLTPTVTLTNGAVLQFATRTTSNPAMWPDRLEVYISTAGSGTNV